jgi:hypothetical protein
VSVGSHVPDQAGTVNKEGEVFVVAYAQPTDGEPPGWRARFKRPDGTWGSRSGFNTDKAAEAWGVEQEALIRRNLWLDPREAEILFGVFAEDFMDAVGPRLEPTTLAKYRSFLDNHLLPQWSSWPLAGIFNSYVEIEKWLSELHEDYADSSVSSIFSLFSTILGAAVKARKIPANPCAGIRVTSGEFEVESLVATPVQALRASMRLYESGLGLAGFVLGLLDFYTGARWGELVGQQRHEYDAEGRAIQIREPLKEVGGHLFKGGRRIDPSRSSTKSCSTATLSHSCSAARKARRCGGRTSATATGARYGTGARPRTRGRRK